MRFLVGYAADAEGRDALALGSWLAREYNADIVIAYVVPDDFPVATHAGGSASFPPEFRDRVQAWLDEAQAWCVTTYEVTARTRIVPSPSAAGGLVEVALDEDASLLVLGPSRHSTGRHFSIGTVTGRLIHSSPVPLAMAPPGFVAAPGDPVTRVWCGYAGSIESRAALKAAEQLARRLGAPLRLANIVSDHVRWPRGLADVERVVERHVATAERVLEQGMQEVAPDLSVDSVVLEGDDVEELVSSLDPDPHNIVVLGSSPAGPGERVFFGSTASRLLRATPWPVIAVPQEGRGASLEHTGPLAVVSSTGEEGLR